MPFPSLSSCEANLSELSPVKSRALYIAPRRPFHTIPTGLCASWRALGKQNLGQIALCAICEAPRTTLGHSKSPVRRLETEGCPSRLYHPVKPTFRNSLPSTAAHFTSHHGALSKGAGERSETEGCPFCFYLLAFQSSPTSFIGSLPSCTIRSRMMFSSISQTPWKFLNTWLFGMRTTKSPSLFRYSSRTKSFSMF